MLADSRKFVGRSFGLSISRPPDGDPNWPAYYGDPSSVVNQFVFTEGSNFLFEGGRLVLGHRWADQSGRWNEEGILSHFVNKSREFQSFRPSIPDPQTGRIQPTILNVLAWPDDLPSLDQGEANRLISEGILSIEQVQPKGFAPELLNGYESGNPTLLHRYAYIRSLTAMRQRLVEETEFRICIGGDFVRSDRRLPGVIEEALLTCAADRPLYVSDAFGGASKALAECLLQRRVKFGEDETFYTPSATADLMLTHFQDHPWSSAREGPSTRAGWNAFTWFQNQPLEQIAARAGLTMDQYIQVLAAKDVESSMGWILFGIRELLSRK